VLSARLQLQTEVLRVAISREKEYPWFYALTLSGIEVSGA
jgi:hypothetical protein